MYYNKLKINKMKPFISVVVAAFNEEKYLPLCLASLKAQTFSKDDYEVIVVDNNSTDNTVKIAKNFGAKVIKESKQGYVFALNRGMKEASADIIAVTDADTQVYPDWLSVVQKAFYDDKIVIVSGISRVQTGINVFDFIANSSFKLFTKVTLAIKKPNVNGFNFAVRKKAFEKVGGLDERFQMSPDVDLGIRLMKIGGVKMLDNLFVNTSLRRWQKDPFSALIEYLKGHIYTAWLRKPPPVKQKVIR